MHLGRRLGGQVRPRARRQRHLERQPVACSTQPEVVIMNSQARSGASGSGTGRAAPCTGRAPVEVGEDRLPVAPLEASAGIRSCRRRRWPSAAARPGRRRFPPPVGRAPRRPPMGQIGERSAAPIQAGCGQQRQVEQQVACGSTRPAAGCLRRSAVGEDERLVRPRISRESCSITSRLARRTGRGRSVMTDVRLRDAGPFLRRDLVAAATSIT